METIATHIRKYLEDNNTLSGPGGKFTGENFLAIEKVLSGKANNFIVFNNGGGKIFEVWMYDTMKKHSSKTTLKGFKGFAKKQRGYIYMQKIEGKEEIFTKLPSAKSKDVYQDLVDILAGN